MIDSDLRTLERRARQDQSLAGELAAASIRAGGRDPRRDPSDGDRVQLPSGQVRQVLSVWPRITRTELKCWRFSPLPHERERSSVVLMLPVGTLIAGVPLQCVEPGLVFALVVKHGGERTTLFVDERLMEDGVTEPFTVGEIQWNHLDAGQRRPDFPVVVWRDVQTLVDPRGRGQCGHRSEAKTWRRAVRRASVVRVGWGEQA